MVLVTFAETKVTRVRGRRPGQMIVDEVDKTNFSVTHIRIYFWKEYLLPVGRRLFDRSRLAHELRVLHDV